ncbi:MAG: Membrane-associated protein containing RNA-binding TRAM domain and ribonuclease PIN-domain, YacL B.subtilis ortholog [uncultured Chloroflexia bacterium]|uniref:Membrane-associated protein containing RNA-binding TRAM domain and ribonuclease PIN-domain, YacL B.subtilis ortholog n=1 Tax=uncultured Chloroflexia bacterium TaxID=1672391 RepID=A0A6J4N5Z5_9CHLR|nr:MAG: Membrane-associated protein containing RNA-binding TRAM domain and ribonuclease PIN-domain, YacL B.subtilis ortholog [uncultured Chloroflexia bacterium]
MKFSPNFYARLIGGILLGYAGYYFSIRYSTTPPSELQVWATSLLSLCGLALGLILTPYATVAPLQRVLSRSRDMELAALVVIGLGALFGLIVGVLLTFPVSQLPGPLGQFGPALIAVVLAYVGSRIASTQKQALISLFRSGRDEPAAPKPEARVVVDTSVIIDGRVAKVVEIGFLAGTLVVPQFVLHELQQLADSSDDFTRTKGKRGLDVLRGLQTSEQIEVAIVETMLPDVEQVDDKLVAFARAEHIPLLTNDMNLHQVAQLQGVHVLNLNQLADAVRLQFANGDRVQVLIRNEGREREQGVGFTEDGTMIVVEDARRLVGQEVTATVTRVYTTQSGRIIFAQLS